MNHAAKPHPNDAARQAAARRFGFALLLSAGSVAAFAFMVYRMSPPTRTVASTPTTEAGIGIYTKSSGEPADGNYANLVAAFTEALQRDDDIALRAVYPTISDRELRVLHAMRRRLGASILTASGLQLRQATPDHVIVDFEIVASGTHLPFQATIGKSRGAWLIENLR